MDDIIPPEPPHKQCTYCGKDLPATPEFFHRNKLGKYGLQAECKPCARARNKEWRERPGNKEHQQEYHKAYHSRPDVQEHYKAHQEEYLSRSEVQARRKAYREEYRSRPGVQEHEQARQKSYLQRPEVKEHRRAHRKVYENRPEAHERIQNYGITYRHRPDIQQREQARRKVYRSRPDIQEREAAERKAYYARPEVKERYRVHSLNRRGKKKSAPGTHTLADIQAQRVRQKGKCYYCHKVLTKYHVDHVIPLSCGGSNGPENLVITCPRCNLSKHDRLWTLL